MKRLALYCRCGAAWTGTLSGPMAAGMTAEFHAIHNGPDHGPATAREAAAARAREEKDFAARVHKKESGRE